MKKNPVKTLTGKRIKHGTVHTYNWWGCRCQRCIRANSKYRKAYKAAIRKANS